MNEPNKPYFQRPHVNSQNNSSSTLELSLPIIASVSFLLPYVIKLYLSTPISTNPITPMRIRSSKFPPLISTPYATPPPSSTPTSSPSPPSPPNSRCEGLDLLVMAITEVSGDRALGIDSTNTNGVKDEEEAEEKVIKCEVGSSSKRKRKMVMPVRYQDSVLQSFKPRTRRRPIGAE